MGLIARVQVQVRGPQQDQCWTSRLSFVFANMALECWGCEPCCWFVSEHGSNTWVCPRTRRHWLHSEMWWPRLFAGGPAVEWDDYEKDYSDLPPPVLAAHQVPALASE